MSKKKKSPLSVSQQTCTTHKVEARGKFSATFQVFHEVTPEGTRWWWGLVVTCRPKTSPRGIDLIARLEEKVRETATGLELRQYEPNPWTPKNRQGWWCLANGWGAKEQALVEFAAELAN